MSGSLYGQAAGYANQYGVPTQLFQDVITAESGFNPNAYNPASGATGIAQFLPSTAANAGYGIAPFDPTNASASLSGAAQYLAALKQRFGSWTGALNAYSGNTGGGSPYPGNSSISNDLAALEGPGGQGGQGGNSAAAIQAGDAGTSSGAAGGSGSCGLSPGCWLAAIGSWAGNFATRAALVVVAIIFLLGALYLFGTRSETVQSVVKAAAA